MAHKCLNSINVNANENRKYEHHLNGLETNCTIIIFFPLIFVHICLNVRRLWYYKLKYCRLGLLYWTVNPYARSLYIHVHIINIQNTTRNLQTHNMTETNCKKWTFYFVLELQNRLDKKISFDVIICKKYHYMIWLNYRKISWIYVNHSMIYDILQIFKLNVIKNEQILWLSKFCIHLRFEMNLVIFFHEKLSSSPEWEKQKWAENERSYLFVFFFQGWI